jgi:NAD(P)-dependent dehydrogenase (short-subunit alcohol dehydrogenase family)
MGKLDGKVALITGGARGIGLAAAKRFVAEGSTVVLVDLDEEPLNRAVAEVGKERAIAVRADVTRPEDVERYVRSCVEHAGGIDVYLANAGVEGAVKPIPEYPVEIFDRVIAVNVRGVWLGLKHVIPRMVERGGGSIVITSSVAGIHGYAGVSAYVTSKHAVVGLMRTAALECAPHKIRVNTVNPAPIETRMMRSLEDGFVPGQGEQAKRQILTGIPMGRYGTPEEVADLMLFLACDESRYLTGGVYMVDGGISAV